MSENNQNRESKDPSKAGNTSRVFWAFSVKSIFKKTEETRALTR